LPDIAIELDRLTKRFGPVESVSGLSLSVRCGVLFGVLGPNGAGKTTTIRCLLGLVRPTGGTVRVLGLDPARRGAEVRSLVGVLLENDGLYDRLSAYRNLLFHARIHRLAPAAQAARIQALLETFGLWQRRNDAVASWSKGMRQKLAIARSLLHQPRLLLLDEPFAGLDPAAAVELRDTLRSLVRDQGLTVVMTTHDLGHTEKTCDEIAIMKGGRLLQSGPLESLRSRASTVSVRVAGEGLTPEVLQELCDGGLALAFEPVPGGAIVRCARDAVAGLGPALIRRGVMVQLLCPVPDSLEQIFLSVTGSEEAAGEAPRNAPRNAR
jgi:ABC-2 type transport system ATP-binding protein